MWVCATVRRHRRRRRRRHNVWYTRSHSTCRHQLSPSKADRRPANECHKAATLNAYNWCCRRRIRRHATESTRTCAHGQMLSCPLLVSFIWRDYECDTCDSGDRHVEDARNRQRCNPRRLFNGSERMCVDRIRSDYVRVWPSQRVWALAAHIIINVN